MRNLIDSYPAKTKTPARVEKPVQRAFTVKDLIVYLVYRGYRYYKPVCRTWTSAFILKQDDAVLCVLFRKNGIDLRYFAQYTGGITIEEGNRVALVGGELFRNHYNQSSNLLTRKVMIVAKRFSEGVLMPQARQEDGRSYTLNPNYTVIKEKSREAFQDLYEYLQNARNDRNLMNYLSDCGTWPPR